MKQPSNSLLQELNNNPTQFTRIMEILNSLQANAGEEEEEEDQLKKIGTTRKAGFSTFNKGRGVIKLDESTTNNAPVDDGVDSFGTGSAGSDCEKGSVASASDKDNEDYLKSD